MREPSLSEASFPVTHCGVCDKTVLTYLVMDEDGEERRCCAHCDGVVESDLRWVNAGDLEAGGYYFGAKPPAASAGCGSGCGSCSVRRN